MKFAARNRDGIHRIVLAAAITAVLLLPCAIVPRSIAQNSPPASPPASSSGNQSGSASTSATLPRGKKLILKDGSFQPVREYQVEGDRVRYYSLDSQQWEEMPASMVDWDATKKEEAEEAKRDAAILAKVHTQELPRTSEHLDIDASLELAPGIFLPPGNLLFAFDGKTVLPVSQAETSSSLSKGRLLEQVLVPIPIIPTRYKVSIQGAHAKLRLMAQPEFYMRTADARAPQMALVRAKINGGRRLVENLDQLFGQESSVRREVSMQRWDVAQGVYRFTLSEPLPPGEYAMAEIVQDQTMSLFVWDFGVDEKQKGK